MKPVQSIPSDSKAVVRRWGQLWSSGCLEDADGVFAKDVHDHRGPPFSDLRGIEAELQFIRLIRSAFPDLRVDIEDILAEEDRVAARVLHRGTHCGALLGIPPTGRRVTYEGTVIFRIVDDRIADRWGTVDLFALLLQLGAAVVPLVGTELGAASG